MSDHSARHTERHHPVPWSWPSPVARARAVRNGPRGGPGALATLRTAAAMMRPANNPISVALQKMNGSVRVCCIASWIT